MGCNKRDDCIPCKAAVKPNRFVDCVKNARATHPSPVASNPGRKDGRSMRPQGNSPRAGLASKAEDWRWSSLWRRVGRGGGPNLPPLPLALWPIERPKDRLQWFGKPPTLTELEALRRSMRKGVPCEEVDCQRTAIREHGLESSIRRPVRPKKEPQ